MLALPHSAQISMSRQEQKPRKLKKRKRRASVGGISQSAFANRAMSNAQQAASSCSGQEKSVEDDDEQPDAS